MTDQNSKIKSAKRNALRVVLLSMIIVVPACIYFIFFDFGDHLNIGFHGYVAHILGVVLAFVSAFLFMGITFFSSRGGYDDQPNYRELVEKERAKTAEEKTRN